MLSRKKLKLIAFLFIITFLSILIFLFRWQIIDHDRFLALANSRFKRKEIPAMRGDILANDESVLAFSEPRFNIFVYKNEEHGLIAAENAGRQTRDEFLLKVAQALLIDDQHNDIYLEPEKKQELINEKKLELSEKLNMDSQWIKIADKVSRKKRDIIMSLPTDKDPDIFLDGLSNEEDSIRIYPESNLASHVIGFLGKDEFGVLRGSAGIEQYFDGILKPQDGISNTETDSNENIIAISESKIKDAKRGSTIQTTIDKNLQLKVEKILEKYIKQFQARSGTIIIIDPLTGAIKVMANFPNFDPNNYEKSDPLVLGNTAITNPYEIGSVGKVYTMSAAVDQGKVLPQTIVIQGHEGCQKIIEGKIICTYDKKPQGALTATQAMIKSDNLALFATANMVGQEKLAEYLSKFGMGQRTGLQLSGEDAGYIKKGQYWNEADLAAYSYGHSYFQTPIQAAVGISSLANKGVRMEPMIVKEIIEADGTKKTYKPLAKEQVISEKSSKIMGDILYEVFLNNIPEKKYEVLKKYKIGMKSGTALIPYTSLTPPKNIPGYSDEVNSTYIGFDASDKHTFLMLVNVSEPQTGKKLSYYNARLLWLDTFMEIKDDLAVPEY